MLRYMLIILTVIVACEEKKDTSLDTSENDADSDTDIDSDTDFEGIDLSHADAKIMGEVDYEGVGITLAFGDAVRGEPYLDQGRMEPLPRP